jgi:tetratricopeptide (TPR) repeat protein
MRDPSPSDLEAAELLLRQGDVDGALQQASAALASGALQPAWHRLRALALAAAGRATEARGHFSTYAQLCPDDADAWVNLGTACLECGDRDDALQAFIRAGTAGAQGVPYLLGRGLALLATGRFADAASWLQQAQAEDPSAADVRLARGQCLAELERYADLDACVAGVSAAGLAFEQRTVLAWLLAQAGRDEAALALYRELLAEQPAAPAPRVQMALLLERLNRTGEAAELLGRVDGTLDSVAGDSMAALAIGRISRRQGNTQGAFKALSAAAGRELEPAMAAQLWFECAKCHDQLEQADAAMHALTVAHREATRALEQRHPGLERQQVLAWLRQRLRRPLPAPHAPHAGEPPDPVFLVGFPRSGTTLLEQMLANHSCLQVLDERPALESAIATMQALPAWQGDDLDADLAKLDAQQCRQLRAHYRAEVARHLPPGGRLVDKYPLYLTRVGHIQRLFPRSDWVFLLRHPCDCVLSCHMQAFGLNGGALAFASLESTARTYAAVMGYWEQQRLLARPRVHTLRYEDLAAHPAAMLGQLMAFLSLSAEPAQLAFQDAVASRTRRINTPSYAQVSEPVHSRAVGRWRLYRAHFTPATLDLLAPFVERYGYSLG